ncbi:MAG: 3-phosphoshikimate 1-carboxyvinyltransferase [Candidatus Bathyarchaeota archaeon]|nr:3-phosphoshikimate 1-carboxyvinyltransferase [Candidatus Bathyarchaeota archaeon]
MEVTVENTKQLKGVVSAPPSKAYTHRMLIAAALSDGTSKVFNPLISDDTTATLNAVQAFGAKVKMEPNVWVVTGVDKLKTPTHPIDCRESGSTLRFLIPVAALAEGSTTFLFSASFKKRPIEPLLDSLKDLGVESSVTEKNGSSVEVTGGGITGGHTSIRGDVSSQFISGLLFACPKAETETRITVTTDLESKSYVDMTMDVILQHDIKGSAVPDLSKIWVYPNQKYSPCDHTVPGDFSSAAFLFAAAAVTKSEVTVNNLNCNTIQGDKAILDILEVMGTSVMLGDDSVTVQGAKLEGVDIDAKDIPDLVPVLVAVACFADADSEIFNAKRLRLKESDRLASITEELTKMGAVIEEKEDGLIITGSSKLHGALINPHNDHRIAMACAVAALGAEGKTVIQDVECINKSYPKFFDDLRMLGARVSWDQIQ